MIPPDIRCGDCREVMAGIPADSIDTIITDPPYGLAFMGKGWDHAVPGVDYWEAALRVAKPGAMLLAFGGTRTFHRLTCAIEEAGWEIRDCLMWLHGQGFPKSHNLGGDFKGWGTALKPAWEPIILAMKPTEGTFANNAAAHGVAGLAIDAGRIGTDVRWNPAAGNTGITAASVAPVNVSDYPGRLPVGRWPANVLLDEEAAAALDEQTGTLTSGKMVPTRTDAGRTIFGSNANGGYTTIETYGDSGGASRFFYCAKAARSERGEGNDHPTVKPLALMRYLCRLTKTPTGGTVLDPFAGSGSTLIAAGLEGRPSIGIELDPHNAAICVARTAAACA